MTTETHFLRARPTALSSTGRVLLACAGLGLGSFGCGEDAGESGPSAVDVLVQGLTNERILPAVDAFRDESMALDEAATELCEAPDDSALEAVQAQWLATAEAWYRLQLFNTGPADADPVLPLYSFVDSLRLRGMDYTDGVRASQEAWLAGDEALNEAFFAEQRFDDVGLLAVEVAAFDGDDVADVLAGTPRRCRILRGLTRELEGRARELRRGWRSSYEGGEQGFAGLLLDDALPSGRTPLAEILIAAQSYVDYLHKRSVVNVAAPISGEGWALMEAALEAIEGLLRDEVEGGGVFDWMERLDGPASVEAVEVNLDAAHDALAAQDAAALEAALVALDNNFKGEIPGALQVELGINFSDGD